MEIARSDYEVSLSPLVLPDGTVVEGYRATVRERNGRTIPLGVVGSGYEPLQNRDAFSLLEPLQDMGASIETMGVLGNGEKAFASVKFPETVEVAGFDTCGMYALIVTGHDGHTGFSAHITPVRAVCANTVALAVSSGQRAISLRHTSTIRERVEAAKAIFREATTYASEFEELAGRLASIDMDISDFHRFLGEWLPMPANASIRQRESIERRRQDVASLWNAPTQRNIRGTRWAAYNCVAEYVDHIRPVKGVSGSDFLAEAKRGEATILGTQQAAKDRAQKLLLVR